MANNRTLKTWFIEVFWLAFCKGMVWETFCKKWVWQTFCKKWVWQTFCKKWVWQGFCVNLVYKKFDKWKAWIYLAPAMVLLAVFTFWPIFNTVRISFLDYYSIAQSVGGRTFTIGIENYKTVLINPDFKTCLGNTLLLCFLTGPISTLLALLIAVCLNAIKPLQRFLQTVFFMPYVTNSIAIGMVFAAMFGMIRGTGGYKNPESVGIINNVLQLFGFDFVNWINEGSP